MADNEETRPAGSLGGLVLLGLMTALMVSHYAQVRSTGTTTGLLLVQPVFIVGAVLAVVIAVQEIRARRTRPATGDEPAQRWPVTARRRAAFIASLLLFWLGLGWFGFIGTALALLPVMFLALGARRPLPIVLVTVGTTAVIYVSFAILLGVRLDVS